jgi:leucyl-tRNA synthetase
MNETADHRPREREAPAGSEHRGQPAFGYDARLANEIELRWQDRWEAEQTFATPNPVGPLAGGFDGVAGLKKFYVLDMFPYPSAAGLHVGHPLGYIATDICARYMGMTGHNVLHPLGFDAFGLPAEQYAIATGKHPALTTAENIANIRRQLRRLGLAYDRRREFATTDPAYYRWTQWIFLKIFNSWFDDEAGRARPIGELTAEFESGRREPVSPPDLAGRPWAALTGLERRRVIDSHRLAYISSELVNWSPGLGTVLANEEITPDGRSDVGNYPVYRRPLRQWMLRITAYAERLIRDLDLLDWPEPIKLMQRNWIGPSDGASIRFAASDRAGLDLYIFTTRPDTLPGATYLVLAPEHPAVDDIVADAWPEGTPHAWKFPEAHEGQAGQWTPASAIRAYRKAVSSLGAGQGAHEAAEKTGVFTGSTVTNPMTGEAIPVFVADYVVMGYGTGAIMAVPAHDQRDFEFARRFGLPVVPVLRPPDEWCDAHGITADTPAGDWPEAFAGEGLYLDIGITGLDLTGKDKKEGTEAAIRWLEERGAGKRTRSYRLRDWLFSRQRYWGEPFPIVYDENDMPVALPEEMLPVTLPEMTDFRPRPEQDESADPVPPLARVPDWVNVEFDLGDGAKRYRRETNTMPQWAGSCWYYLRYLDPTNDRYLVDREVERYWMVPEGAAPGDGGVDLYVGGAEHAVLHLLYARFWHKILYDLGYVSTKEPFKRLPSRGYILADAFTDSRGMYVPAAEVVEDGDGRFLYRGEPAIRRTGKMGKSLKNSLSPDEIYARYGADTLRLYEMAMGPLEADRPWRTDDIVGVHRFLRRLWRNIVDEETGDAVVGDPALDEETARLLNRTIMIVRQDFSELRFNTAIARLIELNTHASRVVAREHAMPVKLAEPLLLMVAPLVPHIAEELWFRIGHRRSLAHEPFPEFDEALTTEPSVVIPVQVNGRPRFRIEVRTDAGEQEILEVLAADPNYARHTNGVTVERVVIVPGKIANIVAR